MASSPDRDGSVLVVSKDTIFPDTKSPPNTSVRLFVSEVPMLTLNYIQKGYLYDSSHPNPLSDHDLSHLKLSLSKALSVFPPLAGRLSTDPTTGNISVSCNDAGALFVHAQATSVHLTDILDHPYAPPLFKHFFPLNTNLNYDGHSTALAAVQVTELSDAVFIACSVNHAVVDGTSFYNFFNTFAHISRTGSPPNPSPSFPIHDDATFFHQYLGPPDFRPEPTFSDEEPVKERVFHFSRQAMLAIKKRVNETRGDHKFKQTDEISSFQSLCAQLWRSVTRARKLSPTKTTTFLMPVNCRQRVNPKMDPLLFGNIVQAIRTTMLAEEVVSRETGWTADLLHRGVVEHDDQMVRKRVEAVMKNPRCPPLAKSDGTGIVVGSSPWFPDYEADFGWGPPLLVRSGKSNTFDGECTLFPGREGGGSVDLEVALSPEAMVNLETDLEFMQYVG